eukprot:Tbor_TRINITY_DN3126_c0_g1::TRINITY_DN3126_c0_g1_i1::g.14732::m.14732
MMFPNTIDESEDESEEEDDDDDDEENDENMNAWLKEFPRTGEPLYLENMKFQQAKEALLRNRTQVIPHWQGMTQGTEVRLRKMLNLCSRYLESYKGDYMIAIDTFLLSKFLEDKVKCNWAASTFHTYISALSAALKM